MGLRHVVVVVGAVVVAIGVQQFSRYLSQWDALQAQRSEMTQLARQVENCMYRESALKEALPEAERQYSELRRLLPAELNTESFAQQVEALAQQLHIKVLAQRTAITSHPRFTMATINMTLKTDYTTQLHFMRQLKSIPRRIHLVPDKTRGKESVNLDIAIYAVDEEPLPSFTPPPCKKEPAGVVLPLLKGRLNSLYQEYAKACQFVQNYTSIYLDDMRLQSLQKENRRLQELEQELRLMP